jgi:hypothetical protein
VGDRHSRIVIFLTKFFIYPIVYHKYSSYVYTVRMRDMKDNEIRLWRVKSRCVKGKHAPKENNFGVCWCKDCGVLIKNV